MSPERRGKYRAAKTALWAAAIFFAGGALFITIGYLWAAWVSMERALEMYRSAAGWQRAYLLVGSFVVGYVVARLIPILIRRTRKAARSPADILSKIVASAEVAIPPLLIATFLVAPALVLWPVTAGAFFVFSRRRAALRIEAERRALHMLRHDIAQDGGQRGSEPSTPPNRREAR